MSRYDFGTCPACSAPLMEYRNLRGEVACINLHCRWAVVTGNARSSRRVSPDDYMPTRASQEGMNDG